MGHVVITGGAGFVGSHLAEAFLARGDRVTAVDNFITGSPDNVRHLADRDEFNLVEQDVSDHFEVEGDVDAVLHFASPASPKGYLQWPIQTLKVGSLGTHNALGLARAKGARFVMASTSEVYGDPDVTPQPETYWGNVNPVGPRGVYDEAKRFSEAMTGAYRKMHGVQTQIVRIFNTYGPRMAIEDGRALPAFVTAALRGEPLVIFPEGTRSKTGELKDFKRGAFDMARDTDCAIVPIVIRGTSNALPKHGFILQGRHPISVTVLPEVPLSVVESSTTAELSDHVHKLIADELTGDAVLEVGVSSPESSP